MLPDGIQDEFVGQRRELSVFLAPFATAWVCYYYSDMYHTEIDDYVLDVLMRDLAGHDRSPAAFLVYLVLYAQWVRSERRAVPVSLQRLAAQTGLSKSAVQAAVRLLRKRSLVKVTKVSATSVSEYELVRHWVRRRPRGNVPRGEG